MSPWTSCTKAMDANNAGEKGSEEQPMIAPLNPRDAMQVARMLGEASPEYGRHFHPFPFDEETVLARLTAARRDRYWGIWIKEELAGLFMLRGFDAGYERPAFGVFIAERFSGQGLARLALVEAIKWCERSGVSALMLTVEQGNTRARRIYEEAGFAVEAVEGTRTIMARRVVT